MVEIIENSDSYRQPIDLDTILTTVCLGKKQYIYLQRSTLTFLTYFSHYLAWSRSRTLLQCLSCITTRRRKRAAGLSYSLYSFSYVLRSKRESARARDRRNFIQSRTYAHISVFWFNAQVQSENRRGLVYWNLSPVMIFSLWPSRPATIIFVDPNG